MTNNIVTNSHDCAMVALLMTKYKKKNSLIFYIGGNIFSLAFKIMLLFLVNPFLFCNKPGPKCIFFPYFRFLVFNSFVKILDAIQY